MRRRMRAADPSRARQWATKKSLCALPKTVSETVNRPRETVNRARLFRELRGRMRFPTKETVNCCPSADARRRERGRERRAPSQLVSWDLCVRAALASAKSSGESLHLDFRADRFHMKSSLCPYFPRSCQGIDIGTLSRQKHSSQPWRSML